MDEKKDNEEMGKEVERKGCLLQPIACVRIAEVSYHPSYLA